MDDIQDYTKQDYTKLDGMNWNALQPAYDALARARLTPEGVADWLAQWSDLEKALVEASARAERARSEDTTDAAAEAAYLHFVQEIVPRSAVAEQALKAKLLTVPGYVPAPEHAQMVKRLRGEADLYREENVALQSELDVLATEYDKIAGGLVVTLDGEEQTLPQAGLRLRDTDRARREEAWRAMSEAYLAVREPISRLYLHMLALRRRLAQNAGRENYRAYRWEQMSRFDYTPADALAFGDAIEAEIVPLVSRLQEKRRVALGVQTLRPWDLNVDPAGHPPLAPFADAAELEDKSARIFSQVALELGAQFNALRPAMLDLPSRKGKAPGGYCTAFPVTGLPYIFMNAVGTHDDVQTLLHEGGHAFHDIASGGELVWNQGAPIEFAEVASMGMEMLAMPYLAEDKGGFYSSADAARARQEHLERTVQFLPYMAVVDGFQHWVYADAPDGVTAADMDAKWGELAARFMPGVDYTGLEDNRVTGWHRKLHLYQYPFYYVEYGLAQLGALQVWRNALANQEQAVADYRAALALGNTRPLPELFAAAGARLAFDRGTVAELALLVSSHLTE